MKARILILLSFLYLAGCATTLTPEYQASLDSWVGAPVADFIAEHREPDSMTDMVGYRVYVWNDTRTVTGSMPSKTICGRTAQNCTAYGGGAYSETNICSWMLRVQDNVIIEAELTGDSCDAGAGPELNGDI